MFNYYIKLAWLSILKHWGLSLLMISAIGLGIGATMTTVTVNYLMSSNPIPHKSEQLYFVQLDSWDVNDPFDDGENPPNQLTYTDSTNLMKAKKAFRQNVQAQAYAVIEPNDPEILPLIVNARANSADFFTMFDAPFLFGSGWSESADLGKEQVVVLSKETNERVFGGENSVGKTIKIDGNIFKVMGVLNTWQLKPRFYDVSTGAFDETEEIFVPFSLIAEEKVRRSGNTNCWKPSGDGFEAFLASECIWTQFWVELKTQQDKEEYMAFLNAYVEEQKGFGRFQRPTNNRLQTVTEWLEYNEVVADDAKMMMTMSFMFLLVCLLNTIGLLLAKFLGKAPEIGLRQALGASKSTLFYQYMIEAGCIGIAGGLLGLLLAYFGLMGIENLYGDYMKDLATLDINMMVLAIGLAIVSTLFAGIYPTWRACKVQPAHQLKSQ